ALMIFLFAGYSFLNSGLAQDLAAGQQLFEQNCKQCHAPDKVVVGPALKGVDERKSMEWIIDFVHNSQAVIKSGDHYAVALFDKFSGTGMPPFPTLSAEQITNVVAYVNSVEPEVAEAPTPGPGGRAQPAETGYSTVILILVIVVLALVLLML